MRGNLKYPCKISGVLFDRGMIVEILKADDPKV